jgi:hypothetical protein
MSLHAAVVRAQTLLLDRPPLAQGTPTLLVEVVQREELRFLVSYRALAPSARRRVQRALMGAVQLSDDVAAVIGMDDGVRNRLIMSCVACVTASHGARRDPSWGARARFMEGAVSARSRIRSSGFPGF